MRRYRRAPIGAMTISPIVRYMKNSSGETLMLHTACRRRGSAPEHCRDRRDFRSGYCIPGGILNPGSKESFPPDQTAIAPSTREIPHRIVTTMGEMQGRTEPDARPNNVGLRHFEQGDVDAKHGTFRSG